MSEAHEAAPEGVSEATDVADQVTEETSQTGDDAAAAETEGEGEQPKPKKSAQERINELTAARREAEREAEFWRSKATQPTQPAQQATTASDGEPDPAKFDGGVYDPDYTRAFIVWQTKQLVAQQAAEQATVNQVKTAVQKFEATAETVAEKHPDFYDVVGRDFGRAAALCTDAMREAIIQSEDGPSVAYHIAQNPAEARRIAALSPLAQAMELGKLSARLAEPAKPIPKTATDAPGVTPQVRGAGGRFTVAPDTNDFAAFEAQFK